MEKLYISVTALLILLIIVPVNAQLRNPNLRTVMVLRSCPDFTLQFNINYNQAMGQLAGTYNDDFRSDQFINGSSLGADKGLGGSLIGKIKLDNIGHLYFQVISIKYLLICLKSQGLQMLAKPSLMFTQQASELKIILHQIIE